MALFFANGISLSLLPVAAYCKYLDHELILVSGQEDLMHLIVNDEMYIEENLPSLFHSMGFEDEEDKGFTLLEIDEEQEVLLPWSQDPLAREELPQLIEKRTHEMVKEIDDPYGYEFSEKVMGKKNHPSLEKVQKERPGLYPDALEPKTIHTAPQPQKSNSQEFAEFLKAEEKQAVKESQPAASSKKMGRRSSVRFVKKK